MKFADCPYASFAIGLTLIISCAAVALLLAFGA